MGYGDSGDNRGCKLGWEGCTLCTRAQWRPHPTYGSLLPGGCGDPHTPVCASLALGTAHSFLRETSSLLRSSKVGGGCGDFGVHSLTGEKATSVSRVPLKCPEPALEMLPGLEQGGYIQQCILDVPPQPLGVLQRSRQGAREDWEVRGRRLDQGPWRLTDSIPDLGGYGRHSVHLTVSVLDFLLEIWKVIMFSPVKI